MSLPSASAPAIVDLSARTKLRLTGADRTRFLNGQVSNDLRGASKGGDAIYTCVMTIKGKMCADAFIHATGDALFVDAEPAVRESLTARLEKYIIADDVVLDDVSDEFGLLHVFPLADIAAVAESVRDGAALNWIRAARYGQPGWDVFGPIAAIQAARATLGAVWPILDAPALETRRIVAGIPRWGAELDENTMPAEAGLEERAVSYSKGCYIGQEVVSRIKSVGHVNRHLRGLRSAGPGSLLLPGMSLYPGGETAPGGAGPREVGRVTSVTPDPADARVSIALAFVRRGWETAGTAVVARPAVLGPESPPAEVSRVTVCELPFFI